MTIMICYDEVPVTISARQSILQVCPRSNLGGQKRGTTLVNKNYTVKR